MKIEDSKIHAISHGKRPGGSGRRRGEREESKSKVDMGTKHMYQKNYSHNVVLAIKVYRQAKVVSGRALYSWLFTDTTRVLFLDKCVMQVFSRQWQYCRAIARRL